MAKGTADGGVATGTGQEKVQDIKASAKGAGGDVPAAAGEEEQLVIKAPVHCDGCGRKLRRSLQRLEGVEEVTVDSRTNTVVVRGRKAVENATEIVQVVQRRTWGKAVLVSPSPEKLPQVMVKGKVEPATLVGFIHKCTGRKAAIIRAEPLDDLLRSAKSPAQPTVVAPAPPVEAAESKKDEPRSENPPPGEEKNGGRQNGKKDEEPNDEENNEEGGQEEDDHVDENPAETEKPSDGGGHGGDGTTVLENHSKDDRLFTVPMPAGVVTVAPEMALFTSRSYCYPSYAQYYYHPYQYQQYQYPQPYPAYAASPAAMYGYGYPANYPPEAFSEENPNACTIV